MNELQKTRCLRGICGHGSVDFELNQVKIATITRSPICPIASYSSGGTSKFTRSLWNPRVFHAPYAIPTTIQIAPTIFAFGLKLIQSRKGR